MLNHQRRDPGRRWQTAGGTGCSPPAMPPRGVAARTWPTLCLATCWLLMVCGCGSGGDARQRVTGTVALDGQPVANASISFQPTGKNQGPSAGGVVKDGRFELPAEAGVLPGEYLVMIQVVRETGKTLVAMGEELPEAVPVNIKEQAGIPVTIEKGGPHQFDFEVHAVGAGQK